MDINKKACLINASWGAWYPRGSERLERSMIYHGWNYPMHVFKNEMINYLFDPKYPYTIKAAALQWAIDHGYTRILWMDCSLWVTADPNVLMDIIDADGGLFIKSGYNMAQTSADSDLQWAGMNRDEAEKLDELWSCVFGINIETERGKKFVEYFLDARNAGVFHTSREHNNASNDPRFLFSRQDQTAASLAFYKAGFDKIYPSQEFLSNYTDNKDTLIKMRGM